MRSVDDEHAQNGAARALFLSRAERFRLAGLPAFDAIATLIGFYGALWLVCPVWPVEPPSLALAATVLVLIRIATVFAAGLHRWPFQTARLEHVTRLVLATIASSIAFALAIRTFPPAVHVVEFLVTTAAMIAVRQAPRVVTDLRARAVSRTAQWIVLERPRRFVNVVAAVVLLALTFPVWILIALAIKLTSPGPVFYAQERVGLDRRAFGPTSDDPRRQHDLGGRPFVMYKFRTMQVDAEASTGAVWSSENDARVTPVGRFLRHSRLDELPQLVNVLKGDMNLVGPRPERPSIFAELRTRIPDYQKRQRVRPGITGYAQVHLEYDASLDDVANKVRFDLDYVANQGVTADLYIMARTVPVMLFRKVMLQRGRTVTAASVQRRDDTVHRVSSR